MMKFVFALTFTFLLPLAVFAENESCNSDKDCPDMQQACMQGMCRYPGDGPGDTDGVVRPVRVCGLSSQDDKAVFTSLEKRF